MQSVIPDAVEENAVEIRLVVADMLDQRQTGEPLRDGCYDSERASNDLPTPLGSSRFRVDGHVSSADCGRQWSPEAEYLGQDVRQVEQTKYLKDSRCKRSWNNLIQQRGSPTIKGSSRGQLG